MIKKNTLLILQILQHRISLKVIKKRLDSNYYTKKQKKLVKTKLFKQTKEENNALKDAKKQRTIEQTVLRNLLISSL